MSWLFPFQSRLVALYSLYILHNSFFGTACKSSPQIVNIIHTLGTKEEEQCISILYSRGIIISSVHVDLVSTILSNQYHQMHTKQETNRKN